jgi:ketosteroid isomerase-like protein
MDAQQNKRIIMEGLQLFQKGDIQQMLNHFHDDAEWLSPDAEAVPFAGNFHGKQEVARFFAEVGGSLEPMRFDVHDIVAENDKVVVIGEATWRVKATGRTYENPWVNVFTLRDGKVIRTNAYFDTAPAERAFRADRPDQLAAATALRH